MNRQYISPFATGVACRQGTLTPGPVPLGLAYVLLVETNPFSNLSLFYRTMLFEYPSVLSRFCFIDWIIQSLCTPSLIDCSRIELPRLHCIYRSQRISCIWSRWDYVDFRHRFCNHSTITTLFQTYLLLLSQINTQDSNYKFRSGSLYYYVQNTHVFGETLRDYGHVYVVAKQYNVIDESFCRELWK